jgi:hypothetical protein
VVPSRLNARGRVDLGTRGGGLMSMQTLHGVGYGEAELEPREEETFDGADGGEQNPDDDFDADFYDRHFRDRDIDDLLE